MATLLFQNSHKLLFEILGSSLRFTVYYKKSKFEKYSNYLNHNHFRKINHILNTLLQNKLMEFFRQLVHLGISWFRLGVEEINVNFSKILKELRLTMYKLI